MPRAIFLNVFFTPLNTFLNNIPKEKILFGKGQYLFTQNKKKDVYVKDDLIEGEYVNFTLSKSDSAEHPFQASNVRGIEDGPLMCETRYASRSNNDRARTRPRPRGGVRD